MVIMRTSSVMNCTAGVLTEMDKKYLAQRYRAQQSVQIKVRTQLCKEKYYPLPMLVESIARKFNSAIPSIFAEGPIQSCPDKLVNL